MALVAVALAVSVAPLPPNHGFGIRDADAKGKSSKEKKIERLMFTAQYYYLQERDLDAAAAELKKILKLDRGHVEAGIGLAMLHLEQKKAAEAVRVLEKLAAKQKKDVRVWQALASAFVQSGNDEKALKAYEKAVALAPDDRETRYQVYALLEKRARAGGDAGTAKEAALAFIRVETNREGYRYREVERRLVEISGEPVALVVYDANRAYQAAFSEGNIGSINAKMGEALEGYRKCIELQPKNQRCHYGLGLVHSSVKASGHYDRKKAQLEFDKAPSIAEAHFELGRIARYEDDFAAARRALEKAIELRSDYAHAYLELGVVFKLEGSDKKALAQFVRAYNSDPYSAAAEQAVTEIAKLDPDHDLVKSGMLYGGITGDVFSTDRFRAAIGLIEEAYGGVEAEAPEKAILEKVLARVLEAADADSTMVMKVAVLSTPIVNAMAMPNGNIYFTRGFLDFLKKAWPKRKVDANNDVLGHVMAHEVAHVLRKHTLSSALFQEAYKDAGAALDGAILTHVTRLQEIEADRVGIVLASLAGFHPRGGIEFMEYQGQTEEIPAHLDHPTYEERARYLEEYWTNDVKYAYLSFELGNRALAEGDKALYLDPDKARASYGEAIENLARFERTLKPTKRVLNNLGVAYSKRGIMQLASSPLGAWQSQLSLEKESALKYRSIQRDQDELTDSEGATRSGDEKSIPADLTRAMKLFADALRRDPNYARAAVNLATVQIAVGEADKAAKTLAAIASKASLVTMTRGIALAEKGDFKAATKAFAAAAKKRSTRRTATFNLARAYQLAGERDKAKATYQRYVRVYPSGPWAAAAKKALKAL